MNRPPPAVNEYYHIYNRGVDKRSVVIEPDDSARFLQSLEVFNDVRPSGSIHEQSFEDYASRSGNKLVEIVCYCLNPNHFHMILKQVADSGISEFMRRVSCGYTYYFNNKYKRSGSLFQGRYKYSHIDSNDYLLHTSAYVNLNNKVHQLGGSTSKLVRSSWKEYVMEAQGLTATCDKEIILGQFTTRKEYEIFALGALPEMIKVKKDAKDCSALLHE